MGGTALTDRDRVEASSVTAQGDGHQFEIQLGHLCNNRCVFCSSGQLTQLKLARHIQLDPIIEAIERARASGARRITFLGGEPTLHKGFVDALKRTVELGFEEIVIFTNGVLLPHPGFIDKICALGRFEWRISIQGGNEEAHVAVTKRADSFRRIVEGLVMLREREQDVTCNLCVNEESYRSLPDYPALIREHGIRQLHVDIVRPQSTGERTEEYLREIITPYSEMAPYFDRMLAEFDRAMPGFDVNVGNMPYCVMPKWAHVIHHGGEETVTQACDEDSLEVAVDKYAWHGSLRRHVEACESCVMRPHCTGIFSTYLEIHGEQEFRPITREELLALDPLRRHFVLYAERWLAPLYEAVESGDAPLGFSWGGLIEERRAGWVEARLDGRRAAVWLRFAPVPAAPSNGGGSTSRGDVALETNRYVMDLRVDGSVGAEALGALVDWLRARLEHAAEVEVVRAASASDLASRAHGSRALTRGASRIAALADRVESRGRIGVFRCARRRAHDDGQGLVLDLLGPAGAMISVLLSFEIAGERIKPKVDFTLGPGTREDLAEPVVMELIDLLRGPTAAEPSAALTR
jgi:MoaA/NifB/PqqE/SkfB family radical SAM enzyme